HTNQRLSNNPEEPYLRSYAKRLGLDKLIKGKDDVEKFYKFAGPDFDWPPEFGVQACKHVISYIIEPDHWFVEGEGEELATNTLAYHRLLKSNELDSSKGAMVERYQDEYDRLLEQHPGMFYAPVKERPLILIRRSSTIDDIHIRLRCKDDLSIQATMSNIEYDNITNCTYRTIIDTGSTTTTIPYYLRIKMSNGWYGWSTHSFLATEYGAGTKMNKVSRRWEICT
ncbi:43590_t:CDS:2, partial [Gigaspora margarita]